MNYRAHSPQLTPALLRAKRQALGLEQKAFWEPLGVTQSGGSRYESGRAIPRPVELLYAYVYPEPTQLTGDAQNDH